MWRRFRRLCAGLTENKANSAFKKHFERKRKREHWGRTRVTRKAIENLLWNPRK
jgi:hypothetical protein